MNPVMDLPELFDQLRYLDTTSLCDAGTALRVMDDGMRSFGGDRKLVGRAFTVRAGGGLGAVIRALREAAPGDVIVIDGGGATGALAGELFSTESLRKGIAGLVIDGMVRDSTAVSRLMLPVFARGTRPFAAPIDVDGDVGVPVRCGGVDVAPGDVLVGDADGIVVATPEETRQRLEAALAIHSREADLLNRMASGESLTDML